MESSIFTIQTLLLVASRNFLLNISRVLHNLQKLQHGGRVFSAAKHVLITVEETKLQDTNFELIWTSNQFSRTKKLCIGSYYRPPDSGTDSIEGLDDSLSSLYSRKKTNFFQVILNLCGDLNCGYIDWSSDRLYSCAWDTDRCLPDVISKYGFRQHVSSLTRLELSTFLDLVLSSNENLIAACNVIPGICDNEALLFEFDQASKYSSKPRRKIYQYRKSDQEQLSRDLNQFANLYLDSEPNRQSVEQNWDMLTEAIRTSSDKNIPS